MLLVIYNFTLHLAKPCAAFLLLSHHLINELKTHVTSRIDKKINKTLQCKKAWSCSHSNPISWVTSVLSQKTPRTCISKKGKPDAFLFKFNFNPFFIPVMYASLEWNLYSQREVFFYLKFYNLLIKNVWRSWWIN